MLPNCHPAKLLGRLPGPAPASPFSLAFLSALLPRLSLYTRHIRDRCGPASEPATKGAEISPLPLPQRPEIFAEASACRPVLQSPAPGPASRSTLPRPKSAPEAAA